ncbi:MAG: LemA family protein [Verrucomicrobia bacterium]|nr:LemA family protein [Verrucomicrobiota bacterium]
MMPDYFPILVAAVVLATPLLILVAIYNGLVRLRNLVQESWSNVDTELKRRYDLIPNLVETVRGYAAHERGVFEAVAQARAAAVASTGRPSSQAVDENQLVHALKSLFAVVENYPQLKANQNFLKLQQSLVDTEDRIQAARRFYNANVRDYNTRCQTVPSVFIANAFGFQTADFFEIEAAVERQVPAVKM